MADQEVKLRITTDASKAIAGMGGVSTALRKMESDTGGIVGRIKSHWLGLSAAIAGISAVIYKAWNLAEMAAQYEEQKDYLNRLAAHYGTTADSIIADVQRASQGLISMKDIVEVAGDALMKRLHPEQLVKLAEAAEVISNIKGGKVADLFKGLTESIAIGRDKAIKQLIGITDLETKYTDQQIANMSKQEQAHAKYEMVMERVRELQHQVGEGTESNADKMEKLRVQVQDLQLTLGQGLIRAAAGAYGALQMVSSGLMVLLAGGNKIMELYYKAVSISPATPGPFKDIAKQQAALYGEQAKIAMGEGTSLHSDAMKSFELMTASSQTLARAMAPSGMEDAKKKTNQMEEALRGFEKQIESLDPYIDEHAKKLLDIREQAKKLTDAYGNQKRIRDALTKGEYYIELAREKEVLKALADTQKYYNDLEEKGQLARAEALATSTKNRLEAEKNILAQKERYGEVSPRESMEQQLDIEKRIMEAERTRLLNTIAIKSEFAYTDEQLQETLNLGKEALEIEKKIADIEDIRTYKLKEYTDTFAKGLETGFKNYLNEAKTQSQIGEEIAKSSAEAMRQGFEDFFFDPMEYSFENFFESMRRIVAKATSEMLVDIMKVQMKAATIGSSGGGGILGWLGLGGVGAGGAAMGAESFGAEAIASMSWLHKGGIVGREGEIGHTPLFAHAPRFHAGIGPLEIPAILRKDEGVFTPGQMKALGGGERKIFGGNTFIIHMENPVFQDLETQHNTMAKIAEVIARKVAPDAIVENYANDGGVRKIIRDRK